MTGTTTLGRCVALLAASSCLSASTNLLVNGMEASSRMWKQANLRAYTSRDVVYGSRGAGLAARPRGDGLGAELRGSGVGAWVAEVGIHH